jgi:hypothetical protein
MIMKNIFKAALILITLISAAVQCLSQMIKKANAIVKEMLTMGE